MMLYNPQERFVIIQGQIDSAFECGVVPDNNLIKINVVVHLSLKKGRQLATVSLSI